jgi:hypothetical protein
MLQKLLTTTLLFLFGLFAGWGQLTLPAGTSYTQTFDGITGGVPTGWTVRTGGTANSRGTAATLTTTATAWADTGGAFKNFASSEGLTAASTSANQTASTDRALGVRPSGSLGDPGAAFELALTNTTGKTGFSMQIKHQMLDVQSRTTVWTVQYSTNGTTWITVGTYTDPAVFGSSTATYSFGTGLDNVASNVYIRVVALTASGGSGSRDSYAIDDAVLTWTSAPAGPTATTNAATAITAVGAVLNGTANANNATVTPSFEYGQTTAYGTTVAGAPSSVSGTTPTAFTATVGGLLPNTQYNYRAVVTNNGTAVNGTNQTFNTLANVPGTPALSDATVNSVTVTLDATTQNSNSAATTYAIQNTANNLYVQANGALAASAVWQTAATWASKIITGLTPNTLYTFHVKARNANNIETLFGSSASVSTLPNTAPTLQATSLNPFGQVCLNTTTAANTFTVNGDNLTADVTIGPLDGYTFSATNTGTYTSTLTFTPDAAGSVIADVFVKFTPVAVQSYIGNIPFSGGGASTINIAASGSGIDTKATVTTAAASAVTGTTATLGGNVTAEGCSPVTERGVVYATTATPAIGGTGVTQVAATTAGVGSYTVSAASLSASTLYYARAYAINHGGVIYGSQVSFTTQCVTPVNVSALSSVAGSRQATVSWTNSSCFDELMVVAKASADVTAFPVGNGSAYTADPVFGLGTAIEPGEYVVYKGTGTSVIVTGLLNETTYHFTVFTRRGTLWSSGVSKTETPVITYCAASGGTGFEYISGVSFNGTANTSAANTYSNFTSTVFPAEQYGNYPITITVNGGYVADQGLVWIDWNKDGDFDDADEAITLTNSSGAGPYTGTITVPASAQLGNTRMRIRVQDANGTPANATSCGASQYGEVEDYTINIAAGVPPLAAPIAIAAASITPTSFVARWNEVPGASSYRLDVYQVVSAPATDTQGFAAGTTAPAGWEFTGLGTYTSAGNFGAASPSLSFDSTGDRVVTATYSGPATSLSFWVKGQGTNATSALLVEGFNGTSWVTIQNYTSLPSSSTTKTYNASSTPALPANLVKFRFTYTKSQGNLSFDDVNIAYNGQTTTYVPGYNNRTVNGTSQLVTGLQSSKTYYYLVRALSPLSLNSNVIAVVTGALNVWDNGAWSMGVPPTLIDQATLLDDYNTFTDGPFNAAVLSVVSGGLTVAENTAITINGAIAVQSGATMVVESNANVVQVNESAVNTGTVKVLRKTSPIARLDYKLWSSPVQAQNLLAFSPNTEANRFYRYNTATNQYNGVTASSTSFGLGRGYLIRVPNNHPATPSIWTGTFTGVLNTGEIAVSVDTNGDSGYNAIGNPYASPVNADEFIAANIGNIDGTLYFWRKINGAATDAYVTYNVPMGGTVPDDANVEEPNGIIQVGQGFIVNALPTSQNVVFTNAMREVNFANQFYRTGAAAAANTAERHRIWLNLKNNEGVSSQALLGYVAGATNGLDLGTDSNYLNSGTAGLYTVTANKKLAIQGRELPFNTNDVVAVGFKAVAPGSYTIAVSQVDGLFSQGQTVYLKDKANSTVHNLSQGAYSFNSEAGTFDSRFEIVYTDSALGIKNPVLAPENVIVYKQGTTLNISTGAVMMADVVIYDTRGRMIYSKTDINAVETVISDLAPQGQVLLVQITTAGQEKVTKKVLF